MLPSAYGARFRYVHNCFCHVSQEGIEVGGNVTPESQSHEMMKGWRVCTRPAAVQVSQRLLIHGLILRFAFLRHVQQFVSIWRFAQCQRRYPAGLT